MRTGKRIVGAVLVAMALAVTMAYADDPPQQPNVPIGECSIYWWRCL